MINIRNNAGLFFEAVVENRMDPLKLGRVQIRVFGIHTADLSEIPTEELLWASVLMPVTSASASGVGQTPALVEGSHVIGYFRDQLFKQDPIILGSILGIPIEPRTLGTGFGDPRTDLTSVPGGSAFPRWTEEPDTSRLARNENVDTGTILATKASQQIASITTPTGTYAQPESPYNAKYPYNKVIETESGHVIEYDDTPGHERVHIAHRSGTFIEMHPDGTIVCRTTKDKFDLVDGNHNTFSGGTHNLTIDGDGNIYCGGDYTFHCNGDMKFEAQNVTWDIAKTLQINAQNVKIQSTSSTQIQGPGASVKINSGYEVTGSSYKVTASTISFT